MNGIIEKSSFISSINEYDNSYQKFKSNHIPSYKEFFVESSDDAEFYGYYLANIYRVPQLTKFYGCNGKKEVLREYLKYTGKKAGFIVDLDYLPIDKQKYNKVIITTGYSMENFFFYMKDNVYNFELVFKETYHSPKILKEKVKQYLIDLNSFKNKNLLYYAFFKTCMEFSNYQNVSNLYLKIKSIIMNKVDVKDFIDKLIFSINEFLRNKFKNRYEENIKIIEDSGYRLIRGHYIFDHLVEFLRKDGKNIKTSNIRKLAYNMVLPDEFICQIKI